MIKKILLILIISLCAIPPFSFAVEVEQGNKDMYGAYTLLEPLPSGGGELKENVTLEKYVQWMFTFALTIAAFLAVLMITVGGIIYMASGGNESQITKAKGYITNALWGLLLAFGSYLLLYTINPQLVRFKFIESPEEFEVTEEKSSGSTNSSNVTGSDYNPDDSSTWDTARDTDYYDPNQEDFNFTDKDLENYNNVRDEANSYTNEGTSATDIEQSNIKNEDETRDQFKTSPSDSGLINFN